MNFLHSTHAYLWAAKHFLVQTRILAAHDDGTELALLISMAKKPSNLAIGLLFMAATVFGSGCSLLLGGATGAGVGALAGSSDKTTTGESTAIGGVGGAGGGALVGSAFGHPLLGAIAGGTAGAATGYEVKKNSNQGE